MWIKLTLATFACALLAGAYALLPAAGTAQDAKPPDADPRRKAAEAPSVLVYRNGLSGSSSLRELKRVGAGRCSRRSHRRAMRAAVRKGSVGCGYRTPVIGRDLDLAASVVLLDDTPSRLRARTGLTLSVRSDEGSDYSITVFPNRRRWLLSRTAPGDPARQTLETGRGKVVHGTGKRNRLRIRAFKGTVAAWVNGEMVSIFQDSNHGALKGRQSTVSIAADREAGRATGLFDSIAVRVPDPTSSR